MKFWWSRKKEEPAQVSEHGITTYKNKHCRCDECRSKAVAVTRAWQKKAQADFRRTGKLPVYVSHGTANAYGNYGCRCDLCRAATTEYNRARRLRKAAAK